jgi:hypothetical protein
MNHLHQAMNPRIGATGTQGVYRLLTKLRQGLFELVLEGLTRGLALPAKIGTAVVADAQGQPHGI